MFVKKAFLKITGNSFTLFDFDKILEEGKLNNLNSLSEEDIKIVAANIDESNEIYSNLWLKYDIIPLIGDLTFNEVSDQFDKDFLHNIEIKKSNIVDPSWLVELEDYENISSDQEVKKLKEYSNEFQNKKIMFISATPRGGGVALMRHALIRLCKLLNLNFSWHILTPNPEVFLITKRKFHNVLQNATSENVLLDDNDKEIYEDWIKENWEILEDPISNSNIIVIDDPQPSGLIEYIKDNYPKKKIIYRSHIDIDSEAVNAEGTPQNSAWSYLFKNIKLADKFISHPVRNFVPEVVDKEKIIEMPATTDLLDGLNKELSEDQMKFYLDWFNSILEKEGKETLDYSNPYIIQIARFDPSKGIMDVLESYRQLYGMFNKNLKDLPDLVITGHGSIDDPDGVPIYNMVMETLNQDIFKELKEKIKVVRVPHSDQMLNALLRKSLFALQLSHYEGFEIKVTEALIKGKPVIAYDTDSGIPLQIKHEKNGILIDPVGNCETVAKAMYKMIKDKKYFQSLSTGAIDHSRKDVFTTQNLLRWCKVFTQV